jgi:hypothetical protein
MVTICGPGCGRLICDSCGLAGPVWPTPGLAASEGLKDGWEVLGIHCDCPPCAEKGGAAAAPPDGTPLVVEG